MTTIIANVGDLHVNSTVGLMPPKVELDDKQIVTPSATQKWLWSSWLDYWAKTKAMKGRLNARVIGLINGDWPDINTHDGFQLIETKNRDVILTMMTDAVLPALQVCDDIVVIRGTEAHTGGAGWLEERAAKEIGAVRNEQEGTRTFYYWEADIEGVGIAAAHHPGTNSMRPWTAGNEANRRAAMDVANYFGEPWAPQLTLWAHYHHDADSHDTHPIRAIYNRCWQIKTSYVHRLGLGGQLDIVGGLWVICNQGKYRVIKQPYKLPRPKRWTPTS